jgi:Fe-S-cluster containining protein
MALLPRQMRPGLEQDFYLLTDNVACLDGRGCKACGSRGCRLKRENRPVACGLFPLVLANRGLYLYKTCPSAIFVPLAEWTAIGSAAAHWLAGFSRMELSHIALTLPAWKLAKNYIALEIPVKYPL